jgi:ATP-binding protein involved in chromosome partitioning
MSADGEGSPRVVRIWQEDERTLGVVWSTGQRRLYDVVTLRRACTCATCRDEHTGARKLDPDRVPDTVRPERIWSVGRYAMGVQFDDGHSTGIYAFRMLHELPG